MKQWFFVVAVRPDNFFLLKGGRAMERGLMYSVSSALGILQSKHYFN